MTLMSGPIDPRVNHTEVTRFALKHPLRWFEEHALSTVPLGYAGSGGTVYPGYKQLTGFIGMNWDRHIQSHIDMYHHHRRGDHVAAGKGEDFYDEYFAVMDLPGDFYLETIDQVFQRHALARGEMVLGGKPVDPGRITRTALLTIEGEKDDISAPGQTIAAHNLLTGLSEAKHFQHLQPKVGHYGTFAGQGWRSDILPRLTAFVREQGVDNHLKYSEIPDNSGLMPPNIWRKIKALTNPLPAFQN